MEQSLTTHGTSVCVFEYLESRLLLSGGVAEAPSGPGNLVANPQPAEAAASLLDAPAPQFLWPALPQAWHFRRPFAVAASPAGNTIYVADATDTPGMAEGTQRIRAFTASGQLIGLWKDGLLFSDIAVDVNGCVYIAWGQWAYGVSQFTAAGQLVRTWFDTLATPQPAVRFDCLATDDAGNVFAANSQDCWVYQFCNSVGWIGDWQRKGDGEGLAGFIPAIAADEGFVYVVDGHSDMVLKFTAAGEFVREWGGGEDGSGSLADPLDIAVGPDGNVYVNEGMGYCVREFSADGQPLGAWGGTRGGGEGEFCLHTDLAISATGLVFVADSCNDRVVVLNTDGVFLEDWAAYGDAPGWFHYPCAIAVDSQGNYLVADSGNDRIQKFAPDGGLLAVWGETGSGQGQFFLHYYGPYAYQRTFNLAKIAVGPDDCIYVVDGGNHRVQKFTPDGAFLAEWGAHGWGDGQFGLPSGIAVDSQGFVYVSDGSHTWGMNICEHECRIQKFTSTGQFVCAWGSTGTGDGQFSTAAFLAVDPQGFVYAAAGSRVQKFDPDGEFILGFGSSGQGEGQFRSISGIAIDRNGHVLVTDVYANRVQEFTADGQFVGTYGTLGSQPGEFHWPAGVACGAGGEIAVVDGSNHRIQVLAEQPSPAVFPFTMDANWFYLDGRRVFLNILSYQPLEPFQRVDGEIRPARIAEDLQRMSGWVGGSDPIVLRVYAQPTAQYPVRMPQLFYDGIRELGFWLIRDIYFGHDSPGFDVTDFQAGYEKIDAVMAELEAVGGFDRVLAFEIGDEFSSPHDGTDVQVTTFIEKMADYIHAYMAAPQRQAYSNWVTWAAWPPADILRTDGTPILPTNLAFHSYNVYAYEPDRIRDQQGGPGTGRPFAGYLAALKEYHQRRQELVGGPAVWDKPIVIAETGLPDSAIMAPAHAVYEPWSPWYRKGDVDSQVVCEALAERYWDARLSDCVAGMGVFEWNDEWWKAEPPGQPADFDGAPEECFGLLRFEEDGAGGYQARAKLQYETVRQLFSMSLEDGLVLAWSDAASLSPGQTTTLHATASTELTGPLTYRWETSRGFVIGNGPEIAFRAPDVVFGNAMVTVIVMDALGHASLTELTVELAPPTPPEVTLLTLGVGSLAYASGRVANVDLDAYHLVTFIRTSQLYVQPYEDMQSTWVRSDGYFWTPVHNGAGGNLVVYVLPRDRWSPQPGDYFVELIATDPAGADDDGDLLPKWWEETYWGSESSQGRWYDFDGDGANNLTEFLAGTDPTVPDNDSEPTGGPGAVGDGLWDHWEMHFFGTLAYGPGDDPDGDGWDNLLEQARGTNPARRAADADEDGLPDLWEIRMSGSVGLDPAERPFLLDYYEVAPLEGDADLDGTVGYLDYLAFKYNVGKVPATGWRSCDFDGDEDVDGNDFLLLEMNFGQVMAQAAPPVAANVAAEAALDEEASTNDASTGELPAPGDEASPHLSDQGLEVMVTPVTTTSSALAAIPEALPLSPAEQPRPAPRAAGRSVEVQSALAVAPVRHRLAGTARPIPAAAQKPRLGAYPALSASGLARSEAPGGSRRLHELGLQSLDVLSVAGLVPMAI